MLRQVILAGSMLFVAIPAFADKFDDCRQPSNPDKRIQGCTEIIETETSERAVAMAHVNRARGYHAKNQLDLAIADFSRAIEVQPNNQVFLHDRGRAYIDKGQYDLAIADFNRSIENNSVYVKSYIGRGEAYEALGNNEEAIANYRRAYSINPKLGAKARDHLQRLGGG